MSQQKERGSKTFDEIPRGKAAAKPTENAMKIVPNAPRRKYGAHSGLTFNFNVKKPSIVKPFNFDTGSGNEKARIKRNVSLIPRTDEKRTNKEVPVEASMESLKISEESEKGKSNIRPASEGSTPEVLKISSENKNINLSTDVVKSLRTAAEPLLQPSNNVKPRLSNTMKARPKSQIFNDLKSSPSAVAKPLQPLNDVKTRLSHIVKPREEIFNAEPSKAVRINPKKPTRPPAEPRIVPKKYGAHAGLRFIIDIKPPTVVQPFSFENRSPRPRKSVTNDEGTQSKATNVSEGRHQKK